jgi:invasion protein IalB
LTKRRRRIKIADMTHKYILVLLALAALVLPVLPAQSAEGGPMWFTRCEKQDPKSTTPPQCEAFQRLVIKESSQRLAEFAVGYAEKGQPARGIIVLPLGILLPAGVQMQIDAGKAFKFNVRYCEVSGCYAYVTLNDELLTLMRKGTKAVITFQSTKAQKIQIEMSLKGFGAALEKVS